MAGTSSTTFTPCCPPKYVWIDSTGNYSDPILGSGTILNAYVVHDQCGFIIQNLAISASDPYTDCPCCPPGFIYSNFMDMCVDQVNYNNQVPTTLCIPCNCAPDPNMTDVPCWTIQSIGGTCPVVLADGTAQDMYFPSTVQPDGTLASIKMCLQSMDLGNQQPDGSRIVATTNSFCYKDPVGLFYTCDIPIIVPKPCIGCANSGLPVTFHFNPYEKTCTDCEAQDFKLTDNGKLNSFLPYFLTSPVINFKLK